MKNICYSLGVKNGRPRLKRAHWFYLPRARAHFPKTSPAAMRRYLYLVQNIYIKQVEELYNFPPIAVHLSRYFERRAQPYYNIYG